MVNPAHKLKKVAEFGAAAKAIERDIKTFQQARQTFVTSVRVRLWGLAVYRAVRMVAVAVQSHAECARLTYLLQDRLEKEDVSDTLKCLMEHNIVGILCCPLTSGMFPRCSWQ
jgi:hypothetical protein